MGWFLLVVYMSGIFTNPRLYWIGGVCGNFENSCALFHTLLTVATNARLSPISHVNALVLTPIIILVVMSADDPLNNIVLFNSGEETRINWPTADWLIGLTEVIEIVDHIHELWVGNVHKHEASAFAWVFLGDCWSFLLDPINLLWQNTVPASTVHTIVSSRVYQPQSSYHVILRGIIWVDREHVVKSVGN